MLTLGNNELTKHNKCTLFTLLISKMLVPVVVVSILNRPSLKMFWFSNNHCMDGVGLPVTMHVNLNENNVVTTDLRDTERDRGTELDIDREREREKWVLTLLRHLHQS